jgi:hypothetical protein
MKTLFFHELIELDFEIGFPFRFDLVCTPIRQAMPNSAALDNIQSMSRELCSQISYVDLVADVFTVS